MGYTYNARVIYGWTIDYYRIANYLIANQIGTCQGVYRVDETGNVTIADKYESDMQVEDHEEDEHEDEDEDAVLPVDETWLVSDEYDSECSYSLQCFCGGRCWTRKEELIPKGVHIIVTRPYPDGNDEDYQYHISLISEAKCKGKIERSEFNNVDRQTIAKARAFAQRFTTAELDEPAIYAVPEIV